MLSMPERRLNNRGNRRRSRCSTRGEARHLRYLRKFPGHFQKLRRRRHRRNHGRAILLSFGALQLLLLFLLFHVLVSAVALSILLFYHNGGCEMLPRVLGRILPRIDESFAGRVDDHRLCRDACTKSSRERELGTLFKNSRAALLVLTHERDCGRDRRVCNLHSKPARPRNQKANANTDIALCLARGRCR